MPTCIRTCGLLGSSFQNQVFVLIFFFLVGWLVGCWLLLIIVVHVHTSEVLSQLAINPLSPTCPTHCSPCRSGQFLWFCTLQDLSPQLTAQCLACSPLCHACTRKKRFCAYSYPCLWCHHFHLFSSSFSISGLRQVDFDFTFFLHLIFYIIFFALFHMSCVIRDVTVFHVVYAFSKSHPCMWFISVGTFAQIFSRL